MAAKNTPKTFWARVHIRTPDECWLWLGARTSSGYGNLSWDGEHVQAHRVAYFLTYSGISLLTDFRQSGVAKRYRRFVLHKCDVRACCNPSHLFLGSMRSNLLDAYAKGRKVQPRSAHVNAKLSPAQVIAIRSSYDAGGNTQQRLANQFGVSQRVISLIIRRETYRDI